MLTQHGAKAYLATRPGLGQTELWAATPRHRNAVAFQGAATAAGLGPGGQVSCLLFLIHWAGRCLTLGPRALPQPWLWVPDAATDHYQASREGVQSEGQETLRFVVYVTLDKACLTLRFCLKSRPSMKTFSKGANLQLWILQPYVRMRGALRV